MKKRLCFLLLLSACQTQPTKVYENSRVLIPEATVKELSLSNKTIFIDARSHFLFNLSHMPGALNLSWEEFTEPNGKFKGRLVKDLYFATRRLARLGIGPDSSVVVIGDGKNGNGEEGRLAWTLRYLGVNDVNFASKDYFDQTKWTHAKGLESGTASVPPWKPNYRKALNVDNEEIQKLKSLGASAGAKVLIVDVRDPRDFLNSPPVVINPHVKVLNIYWKEFIDEKGRPNIEVAQKLKGINIDRSQRILVIGETGVESGLVVEALHAIGFREGGHFPGGLRELVGKR